MAQVLSQEDVIAKCEELKAAGKKIGFTSGFFDIIHAGHIDYLKKAKSHCDILVVGLNSDSSVKMGGKGDLRPVNPEAGRAAVLEGFGDVDYVFIFSEKNNNTNIELLKPDYYIKAGDYTKDQLSSAPLVEAYGGEVVIIPLLPGFSTTSMINKIVDYYGMKMMQMTEKEPYEKRPAAFLDRDGTICKHVQYLHEPEKFEFLAGALTGMKKFQDAGYRIVVVTNQPGIGLGYFTKEDFYNVSKEMLKGCSKAGVMVDRIYFSPYNKADGTDCRKPNTGLVRRAVEDLNLDLEKSVVIGDMTSDIQLAKNAGCASVLITADDGGSDGLHDVQADFECASIDEAADAFLPS